MLLLDTLIFLSRYLAKNWISPNSHVEEVSVFLSPSLSLSLFWAGISVAATRKIISRCTCVSNASAHVDVQILLRLKFTQIARKLRCRIKIHARRRKKDSVVLFGGKNAFRQLIFWGGNKECIGFLSLFRLHLYIFFCVICRELYILFLFDSLPVVLSWRISSIFTGPARFLFASAAAKRVAIDVRHACQSSFSYFSLPFPSRTGYAA